MLQVDTGSSGLRIVSSAGGGEFNLALPNEPDSSGNPLDECLVFLDGYVWGHVATADITLRGWREGVQRAGAGDDSIRDHPGSSEQLFRSEHRAETKATA